MSDPKSFAVGALIRPRVYVCVCLSACEEEVFEECQECLLFSLGRSDGGQTIVFHGSWHHRSQSYAGLQGPCGTKKKSKTTRCVCVSVLFNHLSVCGKFPLRIEYV